jgi:hypothetical protein
MARRGLGVSFGVMTAAAKIALLSAEKDALVHERQSLRQGGAHASELEHNRLRIIDTQWQLSHAFIEAYSATG